jgi:hypothetical protein
MATLRPQWYWVNLSVALGRKPQNAVFGFVPRRQHPNKPESTNPISDRASQGSRSLWGPATRRFFGRDFKMPGIHD